MDILAAIGNTPLIEIKNINKNKKVKILGKLEGNNPGGSIKDRIALFMLNKAEESGELTHNKTIIEATSGNTGIAIAMIGAVRGYKVKLFMPASVSIERQKTIQAYGAEIVLTPAEEKTDGAIKGAYSIIEQEPEKYFMPNQFKNQNNPLAHYQTTGPEIFSQTKGEIDVFVAAMGTGGTLMGVSKYLKEKKPGVTIIGVEPTKGHHIQGLKNMQESIVPEIFDFTILDDKITVTDDSAFRTARQLASEEGIFVGMSAGAAVFGALEIAKKIKKGTIVVILADRGDRYLSTTLFNQK